VDLPNKDLSLIPGIYAVAALRTEHHDRALMVPIEALVREKENASVFVINRDHKIEERKVAIGLENATKVELLNGVSEGDIVMLGSRAKVVPGQVVEAKLADAAPAKTAKAD
jgi:hypothetical protein